MIDSRLAFSSRQFLRLLESGGRIGRFGWRLTDDRQIWSWGAFGLLGLDSGAVKPSLEKLTEVVHPDDRERLVDHLHGLRRGARAQVTLRMLRPDSSMRTLIFSSHAVVSSDGEPNALASIAIDVTDRERLAGLASAETRRKAAVFEQTKTYFRALNPPENGSIALEAILPATPEKGPSGTPLLTVSASERARWEEAFSVGFQSGAPFIAQPLFERADGSCLRFEIAAVPIRDATGSICEWLVHAQPAGCSDDLRLHESHGVLDMNLEGRHLRAARALLGWSMSDLAKASGVSFSTIRRLEEDVEGSGSRSRSAVLSAFRSAGIIFAVMDDGRIAVGRA